MILIPILNYFIK